MTRPNDQTLDQIYAAICARGATWEGVAIDFRMSRQNLYRWLEDYARRNNCTWPPSAWHRMRREDDRKKLLPKAPRIYALRVLGYAWEAIPDAINAHWSNAKLLPTIAQNYAIKNDLPWPINSMDSRQKAKTLIGLKAPMIPPAKAFTPDKSRIRAARRAKIQPPPS